MRGDTTADARCRRYARTLGALTAVFALQVAAHAFRRWNGVEGLPPVHRIAAGSRPDWLLLVVQLFLFALMSAIAYDVAGCTRRRNPHAARTLGWLGGLYLGGSLGRIAVGLTVANAPPWFTTWSPAFLHVVLAAFVVTLAAYHATARGGAEALQPG